MLAENDLLKKGGQLWLPNLGCVQESIETYRDEIMMHYTIKAVEDPLLNPLYAASENVEMELLRCPDALTIFEESVSGLDSKRRAIYSCHLRHTFQERQRSAFCSPRHNPS
jgi:hypothetical protein